MAVKTIPAFDLYRVRAGTIETFNGVGETSESYFAVTAEGAPFRIDKVATAGTVLSLDLKVATEAAIAQLGAHLADLQAEINKATLAKETREDELQDLETP